MGCRHTYEKAMQHFPIPGLSVVVVKCCFVVCGVRQNLYVFSLYRYPDLDTQIFDCLLTSLAPVWVEDGHASFLFAGDLNGHHHEWMGYRTINRHGVAAIDFATVSGCGQLFVGPTHERGGTPEPAND